MPSHRFHGDIVIQRRDEAISCARIASRHQPTGLNIRLHLFCDASRAWDSDRGGIAITYNSLLPDPDRPSQPRVPVRIAYPIDRLLDSNLGEFIAVAEALFTAAQEIARISRTPQPCGTVVRVKVFNDNRYNLEYLMGRRHVHNPEFLRILKHVLDLIARQSLALQTTPAVDVRLALHWIPGHGHGIHIHELADSLAVSARHSQRAFQALSGNRWDRFEAPLTVRFLCHQLSDPAVVAARVWLGLPCRRDAVQAAREVLGPLYLPAAGTRAHTSLCRAYSGTIAGSGGRDVLDSVSSQGARIKATATASNNGQHSVDADADSETSCPDADTVTNVTSTGSGDVQGAAVGKDTTTITHEDEDETNGGHVPYRDVSSGEEKGGAEGDSASNGCGEHETSARDTTDNHDDTGCKEKTACEEEVNGHITCNEGSEKTTRPPTMTASVTIRAQQKPP